MIEFEDAYEDRIILKDSKKDRLAEIFLRDGELQRGLTESTECAHIGFSYAVPQVRGIHQTRLCVQGTQDWIWREEEQAVEMPSGTPL